MPRLLSGLLLLFCAAVPAVAADLQLDLGSDARTLTTRQLLARADAREITIPQDVAFKRTMRFRAVPLKALLAGITPLDHLQFVASDGFAAEIPAALIWNTQGSEAWLAVEDPARPWPLMANSKSAGPFYLVWTNPQAAQVNSEQWPYQLAAIRKLADVAVRFPALLPDPELPPTSPIRHGLLAFQRTCLACHTLNGEGDSKLGPDLNIPYNPTEYLRADLLRAFIRDPQSLRRWSQAKMQGLDSNALPDADLDAVLAYLRHMAGRKSGAVAPSRAQ